MPIISDEELNRRRHDILVGARKCFADHGYEGATVRLLEEATGKSRGAIFRCFWHSPKKTRCVRQKS